MLSAMRYSWHRDMRGRIDGLVQDVRYAARTLRKNSGFTLVAIAMLGLGIGINALVFTVADTVLYRGFPLVHRNDRLLYMTSGRGCCVSYPDFEDWRAQVQSFEGMALVHGLPDIGLQHAVAVGRGTARVALGHRTRLVPFVGLVAVVGVVHRHRCIACRNRWASTG